MGTLIKGEQGAVYTGVGVAIITSFTSGIFTTNSQLIPVLQFFSRVYPISASNSSLICILIREKIVGYNPLEPCQITLTALSSIILFVIRFDNICKILLGKRLKISRSNMPISEV